MRESSFLPEHFAAGLTKCTVPRHMAHLVALELRPVLKRCGILWCILSLHGFMDGVSSPLSALRVLPPGVCGVISEDELDIWLMGERQMSVRAGFLFRVFARTFRLVKVSDFFRRSAEIKHNIM